MFAPLHPLLSRRALRAVSRGFFRYVFGKTGQRRVLGWRMYFRLRVEAVLQSARPIQRIGRMTRARLWVDGEVFPRIQKLLRRARHTVVIQMFIWKDDILGRKIASQLLEIADDGVKVYVFKEAIGDFFEASRDFLGTRDTRGTVWERFWSHPNIHIAHAKHNDHAKVYIIDDKILLLTGMNIADEYRDRLHDYLVELRGSSYVEHFLTHGELPADGGDVRLSMNTDYRKDIRPTVMELLDSARTSIVVEQCYFGDTRVLDVLIAKSRQGVLVTVIVPDKTEFQHQYANMQSVARLIGEGEADSVNVFLYPGMFHGKTILVDRARAFVGSANLFKESLDGMGEVNVVLQGKNEPAIIKLREALRDSIIRSKPLTAPPRFQWIGRWLAWWKL